MMHRAPRLAVLACGSAIALCFPAFAAVPAGTADPSPATDRSETLVASTPPGFDDLAKPREILADVYFGGRSIGVAAAVVRPGFLSFRDPARVSHLVPNIGSAADLATALSGDLATHAALVCSASNRGQCGRLPSGSLGIIFDEGRFRVDLFVPPAMLETVSTVAEQYLADPEHRLSLTSSVALALAGSTGQSASYNIQDRTILAFGAGRLRSDLSYSKLGLIVDDLVAEIDRHDLRFSGGLFWAPGLDLTGRRRILGLGLGTQFDTRADRETITGTPLVLFLSQPAQVDFVIDGRIVGSRSYDAGNNLLDTAALPEGSYPIVLRIREGDGSVREERRFFVKTPQVAPSGKPLLFAYAGLLANTRSDRPISISDTLYYQAGTARRLSPSLALDLSVVGTQKKAMVEAGGWFLSSFAQVRAAGLVSTSGDTAALLQGVSNGQGRLNFAFDLRRIWSSDGKPLIPLPSFLENFSGSQPTASQIGGSYLQASGSVGYRVGKGYVGLIGSLRKDDHRPSDYSIGPSVTWPLLNRGGVQLTFQADAQKTRTTTAAFVGIRLVYTKGGLSVVGSAKHGSIDSNDKSQESVSRLLAGLAANYYHEGSDRSQVAVGAGIERGLDNTVAHGEATAYTRYGNVRGDVLQNLEGGGGLQYGLTLQSAIAVGGGGELGLGSRDLDDGAVIVEVGGQPGSRFRVFVNEMPYGTVASGGQLPIHLQPYRRYDIRIRPASAESVSIDDMSKTVTLYPGTVSVVRWTAHSYVTAFGQAVDPDGRPVANAIVQASRSVGETDSDGWFQVDVSAGDSISFTRGDAACTVKVGETPAAKDLLSLGKVTCN